MPPWLILSARRLAWTLLCIGTVMHLTVKDRIDQIAIIFYALPLPGLVVLATWRALNPRGSKRIRQISGAAAVALLAWWSGHSWCWHSKAISPARLPGEVRVLFWNMNRPETPSARLAELVKSFDPDIIGCTEPCIIGHNPIIADWQKLLPAYSARPSIAELIWFTRSQPLTEKTFRLDTLGAFAEVQLVLNGKPVHFGVVDVWADPFRPRTKQISEAFSHVQSDAAAIVMGDFNTPADSAHFIPWRDAGFQDSFKEAGRGWRETWFYGLPILSLDHVWVGRDWKVIDCKKEWFASSDHASLMVRLVPR